MKPLVIFDFDGTLCDASHRLHHIQGTKPDWPAFYRMCSYDTPKFVTIAVAFAMHKAGHELWLFSGRSDEVLDKSMEWLHCWGLHELFTWIQFRKAGDYRPDDVIKMEWYDSMLEEDRARLLLTFDDRDRMVNAWRSRGVTCFQVAPGNF